MAVSRGKQFEQVIRESFKSVENTSVYRLQDSMGGYGGVANICDFIIYRYPHQYFIECKSVHGNTFPLSNITKNQWEGLLEMSEIDGVVAGIVCWWVDRDVTAFLPIQFLKKVKDNHFVSVPFDYDKKWILDGYGQKYIPIKIEGRKKRVFFEYDMKKFFEKF